MRAPIAVLLLALVIPAAAEADGQLVPGFGVDGTERVDVISTPDTPGPNPQDQGRAVALGSIAGEAFVAGWTEPGQLVLGDASQSQQQQVTLTRFTNRGHDAQFRSPSPPGSRYRGVVGNFPGSRSEGLAVAFRPSPNRTQERIYVGGMIAPNSTNEFDTLVLSYNRDGELDPGFGDSGVVRTDANGLEDTFAGAMQLADNRVVLAGSGKDVLPEPNPCTGATTRGSFFVGKLTATDGERDDDYGGNGFWRMTPSLGTCVRDGRRFDVEPIETLVHDMAVDPVLQRIYVCGAVRYPNGNLAAFVTAVRYKHDLAKGPEGLTRRWNGGRLRIIDDRRDAEQCTGIDLNGSGATVAVTQGVPDAVPDRIFVHQFSGNGSYFSDFGVDGIFRIAVPGRSLGADALAWRVPVKNRIYVPGIDWGAVGATGDRRVLLAAVRPTGGLDLGFDGTSSANGLLRTNVLESQVDQAFDMAAAPTALTLTGRAGSELLVARYRP